MPKRSNPTNTTAITTRGDAAATLQRLTQQGLAEHLAARLAPRLRHVSEHGTWLTWTDRGWEPDPYLTSTTAMFTDTLRSIGAEGQDQTDLVARRKLKGFLEKHETKANIDAVLTLMARQKALATPAAALDADPDLLGTANATIDLRSGRRRTPRTEDLITARVDIAYDARATCPRWQRFLAETISEDADALTYLQQLVGYTLTGHTSVQQMWLLTGEGSNGKSTFLNTLMHLGGTNATAAADSVLLKSDGNRGANNDIAALAGKRLVALSETDRGRYLNEARLKQLISGDPVAARKLFKEFGVFSPVAKYFLATNHLPSVRGTDNGIWRRLVVIPFPHRFDGDPNLPDELRRELPGILAWAVKGAKAWYANGRKLTPPEVFAQPTRDYREGQDNYGRFLAECTVPDADARTPAAALRTTYETWCQDQGSTPLTPNEVGARLGARGFVSERYGKNRNAHWRGLRLAREGERTGAQLTLRGADEAA